MHNYTWYQGLSNIFILKTLLVMTIPVKFGWNYTSSFWGVVQTSFYVAGNTKEQEPCGGKSIFFLLFLNANK
jgi:hypothetical protein